MAGIGPPPTPTEILRTRGSWRAAARARRGEPQLIPGLPDPPASLDEVGLAKWNELAPLVEEMRVGTKVDGESLALYCETYSRWVACRMFVQEKKSEFYEAIDESGQTVFRLYPQARQMNVLFDQLVKLLREFGFTPSSRTRVQVVVNQNIVQNSVHNTVKIGDDEDPGILSLLRVG